MKIALDVNTSCQLKCNHCYLPHGENGKVAEEWLLETIQRSKPEEIVVVGKEPFFSSKSSSLVGWLAKRHPRVSVITNGIGILRAKEFLGALENVDISMDAGSRFWDNRRGKVGAPPFNTWAEGVQAVREMMRSFFVLHTLSSMNCASEHIDDMIAGAKSVGADQIMFSVFVRTANSLDVKQVALAKILEALEDSNEFMNTESAYLLVDRYHLDAEGLSFSRARELIAESRLARRVELLEDYPHDMGIVRVSASGLLQTTHDALWGPLRREQQGIQLKPGDTITDELAADLLSRFPYRVHSH